jgi:hypothetical protein
MGVNPRTRHCRRCRQLANAVLDLLGVLARRDDEQDYILAAEQALRDLIDDQKRRR